MAAARHNDWERQLLAAPLQGWAVSALFHASMLAVLGSAAVREPSESPEPTRLTAHVLVARDELPPPDEIQLTTPPDEAYDQPARLEQVLAPAGGALAAVAEPVEVALATPTMAPAGAGDRAAHGGPGWAPWGEVESLGAMSDGPATEFFGIPAAGDRFVFVVDVSGSMNTGDRWPRCQQELVRSIRRLKEYQQYYVIFFNHNALPMPSKEMLSASPDHIDQTLRWMEGMQPTGQTNPLPALQLALRLKPDAVFLLSDGDFDPLTANLIAPLTVRRATPIHTIAFVDRAGERSLRAIAGRTRGTYRFVE